MGYDWNGKNLISSKGINTLIMDGETGEEIKNRVTKKGGSLLLKPKEALELEGHMDDNDSQKIDRLLDSIERTKNEWDKTYARLDKMFYQFEEKNDSYNQIIVARDIQKMLTTSLKTQGILQANIQKIRIDKLNIISKTEVLVAIKRNQLKWFDEMEPELMADGKLIFKNPSPEVLYDYKNWAFKRKKPTSK